MDFLGQKINEIDIQLRSKEIRIDVVINNAATKYDNIKNVFRVNVEIPFEIMKLFPKSKVINIISDIVLQNNPNIPEYKASKHALDGLSKSIRAQGRKISNVYPGLTKTKFNIRKGGMNPKEVAEAVYFVANQDRNIDLFLYYDKN
jgi:short-subunit dehydrogenase